MKRIRRILPAMALSLAAVAAMPPVAYGQAAPAARDSARQPRTIRLVVHPQAIARPALKNHLLPDVSDQSAGDAAPLYLSAYLQVPPESVEKLDDDARTRFGVSAQDAPTRTDLYLSLPLDRLPLEDVERFLEPFTASLRLLDQAALRDYCRWDMPIREDGFNVPLGHLNQARRLTNVMNVRTRLHLARNDSAGALRSLQSGFAQARNLNDEAYLIQALVGTGIAAATLGRGVTEWVQRPAAPNLYWPLADLPHPFIDFQAALRLERAALLFSFPQLRRLKSGQFTAEEWREVSDKMGQFNGGRVERNESVGATLQAIAIGTVTYGQAKRWLSEQGVPANQIEAMPVAVAVARYHFGQYEQWYDEMLKWTGLPFHQGYAGLQRTAEEFERSREGNPLLLTIPSITRAYSQGAKLEREIAAMRTVEAIRAFAAAHGGGPPPSLAVLEGEGTPAPMDPTRDEPFEYIAQGDAFTLTSPPLPGQQAWEGLVVEVKLVK